MKKAYAESLFNPEEYSEKSIVHLEKKEKTILKKLEYKRNRQIVKKRGILSPEKIIINPLVHFNYLKMSFTCWKNYSYKLLAKIKNIKDEDNLLEHFETEPNEFSESDSENISSENISKKTILPKMIKPIRIT